MMSLLKIIGQLSFLILAILSEPLYAREIRIAVASNFLLPLKSIAREYEQENGGKVVVSAGSTGKLYAQIVNGAPFDIFLAANSREPKRLEKEGYIVSGSRFTYAQGKLVLWDPKSRQQAQTFDQVLKTENYKRLSLANPMTAPYGAAAFSVLKTMGINSGSKIKILRGENVSQAFQYAATGAADLGFVSLSQIKSLKMDTKGNYWLIDEALHEPILQQAVVLKSSSRKDHAQAFLNYLTSARGQALIAQFGYGLN